MLKSILSTYGIFPFLMFFILLEIILLGKKVAKVYRLNDTVTNIQIQLGFLVFRVFFGASYLAVYGFTFKHLALFHIENNLLTFIICLLLYDLSVYWAHRSNHQLSILWTSHEVHHQSDEMNLSVPLRVGWIDNLAIYMIFFLPLAIIGFGPKIFFLAATVNITYQYLSHTGLNIKFPKWFSSIIVTPEYHRLHHCRNEVYIDKNYAGMFMFYDIIFGTFVRPSESPTLGLNKPLDSWNPVQNNFRFLKQLLLLSKKEKGVWNKVKIFFSKPSNLDLQNLSSRSITDKKFNSSTSKGLNFYCLVQTVFLIFYFLTYMGNLDFLTFQEVILIGFFLLCSGVIVTGILEQKKWTLWAEILRLSSLASIYFFILPNSFFLDKSISNLTIITFCILSLFWYLSETYRINKKQKIMD